MGIPVVRLGYDSNHMFSKHLALSYGLRGPVRKGLDCLVYNCFGASHIIQTGHRLLLLSRLMGKTPRSSGNCRFTLNPMLRQRTGTIEKSEDILAQIRSFFLSPQYPKDAYLQNLPYLDCRELTTINNPFSLFPCKCLSIGLCILPAVFQLVIHSVT